MELNFRCAGYKLYSAANAMEAEVEKNKLKSIHKLNSFGKKCTTNTVLFTLNKKCVKEKMMVPLMNFGRTNERNNGWNPERMDRNF